MASFHAGMAVRDITPGPGVPLWGYSGRSGPATGTLDPLYAKALVFRAQSDAVALVVVDLGRVPLAESCNRIRDRVKPYGVSQVLFTAIHTHHGPVMEMAEAPHTLAIERLIGDALEEAAANLQPARMGVGRAEFDNAHNRRSLDGEGLCRMRWRNAQRLPTDPVDKEARIVKIARADGSPMAVLVHYACHPVIMGPSNLQYSADYVGELTRAVKAASGSECFFLQGGCGDINPYCDKTTLEEGAVAAAHAAGRSCADAVLGVLGSIEAVTPPGAAVAFYEGAVPVGTRWDFTSPLQEEIWGASHPALFNAYRHRITPDLKAPLAVLVLNGNLALVGAPGEFFVEHQLQLKAQSPVPDTLLLGYANDYHAYFPPLRQAAAGGYGGTVGSYVGLGAAEKLMVEAMLQVGILAGRFRPRCSPSDFVVQDAPEPTAPFQHDVRPA